jgi:hypothetical protein
VPIEIDDRRTQTSGVVAKSSYSLVAALAQQGAGSPAGLVVVDGKTLDSPLVATCFWQPANGAQASLLNEHRFVGAQWDSVVD